MPKTNETVHLNSSAVDAIRFDGHNLTVRFEDSKQVGRYLAVDPGVVDALVNARSVGVFFNTYIRPIHTYERII